MVGISKVLRRALPSNDDDSGTRKSDRLWHRSSQQRLRLDHVLFASQLSLHDTQVILSSDNENSTQSHTSHRRDNSKTQEEYHPRELERHLSRGRRTPHNGHHQTSSASASTAYSSWQMAPIPQSAWHPEASQGYQGGHSYSRSEQVPTSRRYGSGDSNPLGPTVFPSSGVQNPSSDTDEYEFIPRTEETSGPKEPASSSFGWDESTKSGRNRAASQPWYNFRPVGPSERPAQPTTEPYKWNAQSKSTWNPLATKGVGSVYGSGRSRSSSEPFTSVSALRSLPGRHGSISEEYRSPEVTATAQLKGLLEQHNTSSVFGTSLEQTISEHVERGSDSGDEHEHAIASSAASTHSHDSDDFQPSPAPIPIYINSLPPVAPLETLKPEAAASTDSLDLYSECGPLSAVASSTLLPLPSTADPTASPRPLSCVLSSSALSSPIVSSPATSSAPSSYPSWSESTDHSAAPSESILSSASEPRPSASSALSAPSISSPPRASTSTRGSANSIRDPPRRTAISSLAHSAPTDSPFMARMKRRHSNLSLIPTSPAGSYLRDPEEPKTGQGKMGSRTVSLASVTGSASSESSASSVHTRLWHFASRSSLSISRRVSLSAPSASSSGSGSTSVSMSMSPTGTLATLPARDPPDSPRREPHTLRRPRSIIGQSYGASFRASIASFASIASYSTAVSVVDQERDG